MIYLVTFLIQINHFVAVKDLISFLGRKQNQSQYVLHIKCAVEGRSRI